MGQGGATEYSAALRWPCGSCASAYYKRLGEESNQQRQVKLQLVRRLRRPQLPALAPPPVAAKNVAEARYANSGK